jgi:RNA polymerase sigma-70 factor (ECF subfamily)
MTTVPPDATVTAPADLTAALEAHRRELTGYCYRMLGSGFEADDAVQETMVRAWRKYDTFEGRSSLRSWLYRIATNVCLDMLRASQRRARPMELGPPSTADTPLPPPLTEDRWISPIADDRILPLDADPADQAEARESIRLAFIAALQHLPARQRAVLILREVLRWQATEVAELLDTTVASVNSALQRARATLADTQLDEGAPLSIGPEQEALLDRYLDAFERYDISSLVSLLHDDVTFTMPPFDLWLRGVADAGAWYTGQGAACEGSRLIRVEANGGPAFAAYKPAGPGRWEPFNVHLVEVSGDRITGLHHFLDPKLFPVFGLPPFLTDDDVDATDAAVAARGEGTAAGPG